MLPVATPPNAIVFSAAKMNPVEMVTFILKIIKYIDNNISLVFVIEQMKAGWFMNLVCVIVICVLMQTWGVVIFDVKTFPDWANTTLTDTTPPLCYTEMPLTSPVPTAFI